MLEYLAPSYTISPEGQRKSQKAGECEGQLRLTSSNEQGASCKLQRAPQWVVLEFLRLSTHPYGQHHSCLPPIAEM